MNIIFMEVDMELEKLDEFKQLLKRKMKNGR